MAEVLATAGAVKIIITGEGANFSAVVADANRQLDKLGANAKTASGHMVTGTQAASASIRVLEGSINNNVRAAERFLVNTLHLGPALQAAFPVVGAIAFGAVIARIGKEVYDFIEQNQEAAHKNAEAWRSIESPLRATNDELQLSNDKLANSIAKIEGKPVNGLKEAIDEAIVSADKLGDHLDADLGKIANAIKTQEAGPAARFLNIFSPSYLTSSTSDVTKHSSDLQTQLDQIDVDGHKRLEALRAQGASEDEIAAATKDLNAKRKAAIDAGALWAAQQLQDAQSAQVAHDSAKDLAGSFGQANRIQILTHYTADLGRASDFVGYSQHNQESTARLDSDQAKKEAQQRADEGQRQRLSAARGTLEAMKAQHVMSLDDEAAYWQKLADTAGRGSILYSGALLEANRARATSVAQTQRAFIEGSIADARANQKATPDIDESVTATWEASMKRDEEAQRKMEQAAVEAFRLATESQKAAEKIEEERIKLDAQMHHISTAEAARQLQSLHQETFKEWSQGSASFSQQFPNLPVPGAAQAVGAHGVQSLQDAAAIQEASALDRLYRSTMDLADSFTNLPAHISQIFEQTINSINDKIVASLNHEQGASLRDIGKTALKSTEKTGLEYIEGSMIKLLTGKDSHKPTGTQNDPWWVRMAADGGKGDGGLLQQGGKAILGWLNDSDTAGQLFGGKLFGPGGIFDQQGSPTSDVGDSASGLGGQMGGIAGTIAALFMTKSGGGQMGTQGNPMYVKNAGGSGGGASSAGLGDPLSSLLSGLGGGGGFGGDAAGAGDAMGDVGGSLMTSLAGFASGGPIPSNMPAIVGENGPEIFMPRSSGRIIPNDRAFGGGDTHLYIDARGSTDPAAVEATVHRAMRPYVAQMPAMARAAVRDHNSRSTRAGRL